jgi:hypothetical protein
VDVMGVKSNSARKECFVVLLIEEGSAYSFNSAAEKE